MDAVDSVSSRTRYKFENRDDENKVQFRRELGTKNASFCVNFKIETQMHLFSLSSLNLFLSSLNACIICNVQYSVLNSRRLYLIPPHILQIQNRN